MQPGAEVPIMKRCNKTGATEMTVGIIQADGSVKIKEHKGAKPIKSEKLSATGGGQKGIAGLLQKARESDQIRAKQSAKAAKEGKTKKATNE